MTATADEFIKADAAYKKLRQELKEFGRTIYRWGQQLDWNPDVVRSDECGFNSPVIPKQGYPLTYIHGKNWKSYAELEDLMGRYFASDIERRNIWDKLSPENKQFFGKFE